ncbi:MAG: hypothetical protein DWQ44_00700 [Bacteroidetes bacterium]|nr:MAG: hypothetical protein DWQ33_04075 [Bacteroidota bacterium]REK07537.1 MAG: hypothetical protein DWQ39_01195 [Bacteroidota bacterium]REK37030.1 MAG: hypothetical protein DWQ44_00700 [Bacteroidota bacterium]REK47852.1 MAG: hypothetical protein DWQ48_11765 [Bacteroidota bacterium]
MKGSFKSWSKKLHDISNRYDKESNEQKISLLKAIAAKPLPLSVSLIGYFYTLLFIMSFPPDEKTRNLAISEVERMAALLKKQSPAIQERFVNSGIPFTKYRSYFSHDCARWLLSHPDASVHIHKIENTMFDLNEVLKITLAPVMRSVTTAGFSNEEIFRELIPAKKYELPFIVNELSRLDEHPYIKDHYFEGLGLITDIVPENKTLSKAYNRIDIPSFFYHDEILKKFDVRELLDRKIPNAAILSSEEKKHLIRVIKNSMLVTERETDPATYLKEDSLRLYHLERGVSVALYGMPADRQLPMESYIGYTMFKNGYPAAYAGGWVFGWRSDYGLNIYDQFRGGESAYMVAQILRVYRQVFGVNYFLVEASQFGLDNEEGIATGVFWFYYKLGFRPIDPALKKLAESEYQKIISRKSYRSSKKTLLKFTDSNIGFELGKKIQPGVYDISARVKEMLVRKYSGNFIRAEKDCVDEFLKKTGVKSSFNKAETEVLREVSLWAAAMKITDPEKLNLMLQMIKLKPTDEYQYQAKLRLFFESYS